jgi:D-sedoheptulose 7-phosphate isomerase
MKANEVLLDLLARRPEMKSCADNVNAAFQLLASTVRSHGWIYICGNGGSASDADHIQGELVKGFNLKRSLSVEQKNQFNPYAALAESEILKNKLQNGFRVISLVSATSLMTAVANDTDAQLIFAQQVQAFGRSGDLFWGISTSGNSKNVVMAALTAKANGLKTLALTGPGGGKLKEICDVTILAPGENVPQIQEAHLPIYHTLCSMLEEEFYGV